MKAESIATDLDERRERGRRPNLLATVLSAKESAPTAAPLLTPKPIVIAYVVRR